MMLVREIDHFEYIITNTEMESLLLEINLIKKYNPKYKPNKLFLIFLALILLVILRVGTFSSVSSIYG